MKKDNRAWVRKPEPYPIASTEIVVTTYYWFSPPHEAERLVRVTSRTNGAVQFETVIGTIAGEAEWAVFTRRAVWVDECALRPSVHQ